MPGPFDQGLKLLHKAVKMWAGKDGEVKKSHLVLPRRSLLLNRYEVDEVIGCGTYGQVWKVLDIRANLPRAMKVSLREEKMYSKNGELIPSLNSREIDILKDLNALNSDNKGLVVQLVDCFELAERVFIIMELMGMCVFDFLGLNHFQPFPKDHAMHISYQLLSATNFLHINNYIHTDIKPENIVLVCADYDEVDNPDYSPEDNEDTSKSAVSFNGSRRMCKTLRILRRTEIRLVDFGSAVNLENRTVRKGKIGTREYRCPESILKSWYHLAADMWSVGCTLVDVWLGFTLLNNVENDVQQLLRMETIFGPIPTRLLNMAPEAFIDAREKCRKEGYRGWEKADVGDPLPPLFYPLPTRLFNYFDQDDEFQMLAFKLIKGLLQYEPVSRLTAEEALKDPLFEFLPDYFK